jgi:4-hydroxy-tetrahydrodipicolinate synthase
MSLFEGSATAIVTPFDDNGVNFNVFEELLEWQIEEGTDAAVICGTTGEAASMTDEEKKDAIKFAVKIVNGRIPVIAGTGSNNTKTAKENSKWAENEGADGLLIVTPYYNKTTQKGLIEHYKTVVDGIKIPVIVYNVPSRTGLNVAPNTLYELSKLDAVKAVKEASSDIAQITNVAALCRDIDIYSGNDDQVVPVLSVGGKGVISTVSNIIPKDVHMMVKKYLEGKIDEARELQLKMFNLVKALFIETNPIPVKTALNLMGKNVGNVRLPLIPMSDANREILKQEMINYGLKVNG